MTENPKIQYFVDESGSGIIFDRNGKITLGKNGCLKYFYLGLLEIRDLKRLSTSMIRLGKKIKRDEYFKDIPSILKRSHSETFPFHAKDDIPEIRRDVYRILNTTDVTFYAVVKDMEKVLTYVKSRNQKEPEYRYHPNELYDFTVRALFKQRLHKDNSYSITFARRGKSNRTRALSEAIEITRERFAKQLNTTFEPMIDIHIDYSHNVPGLQAVDYFLWALQRCYERGEDRYLKYLWQKVGLIRDMDDDGVKPYGVYYNKGNPLTADKLKNRGI